MSRDVSIQLHRQVVLVVDATTYMKAGWLSLYNSCIYPALTYLDARHRKPEPNLFVRTEFALVCFRDNAPYGDSLVDSRYFTSKLAHFNEWAKDIEFIGGGYVGGVYAKSALTEGIYAARELLQVLSLLALLVKVQILTLCSLPSSSLVTAAKTSSRYSPYLLYEYKSTNTNTLARSVHPARDQFRLLRRELPLPARGARGSRVHGYAGDSSAVMLRRS